MKPVIMLIILLSTVSAKSKELADTVLLYVQYQSEYKYTKEQKETFEDTNILEIGSHSSKFYSQRFSKFIQMRDSVQNASTDKMKHLQFLANMYGDKKGCEYEVYKNIPQQGTLTYTDALYYDYYFSYQEPYTPQKWNLVEGDTIIMNYVCNKAVCKYRGREWTAWYSIDLPFDNGPWKLGGLPGLILAASESKREFSFTATGIERARNITTVTFNKKRYESTTPQKLQKMKTDYWKDQWNTINSLQGIGYSEPPKAQRSFSACLMEWYE